MSSSANDPPRPPEAQPRQAPMQPRRERRRVDGVLLLDKPLHLTSNAALQRVKRLFAAERAGHTGTLDPLATGLLPICLGEATKFGGELLEADKRYTAAVRLGVTTATADAEGEVLERKAVDVSPGQLRAALERFTGPIQQVPPMYSALKHQGQPLYKLAREGRDVERKPRSVVIHELSLLDFSTPDLTLDVLCSKGTYVRTLAEDLGRELGCGAHLAGLRRTAIGSRELDAAITLDALEALSMPERDRQLQPVDSLLADWPEIVLAADEARRFAQGQTVMAPGQTLMARGQTAVIQGQTVIATDNASPAGQGQMRAYGPGRTFLGLGERDAAGWLHPKRLLSTGT